MAGIPGEIQVLPDPFKLAHISSSSFLAGVEE